MRRTGRSLCRRISSLKRLIGLTLILGHATAGAQGVTGSTVPPFVARRWTVDDGLPANAVTGAVQGRDGYLWLTTYAGLVRFDGVRFTTYTTETTPALPTDRLLGLSTAPGGALWIQTEQLDIVRFDPVAGTFARFRDGLEGRRTKSVHQDADGTLWVGTTEGLFRRQGRRFVRVPGLAGDVVGIVRDRTGALWVGTDVGGVFRLSGGRVRAFASADGMPGWIETIWTDASGDVWAGPESELRHFRNGRFVTETPPRRRAGRWSYSRREVFYDDRLAFEASSPIQSVVEDDEGSFWIATTSDGLALLRPPLFSVYSQAEGLVGRYVYALLEDHEGSIWLGTLKDGLSQLRGGTVDTFAPPTLPSSGILTVFEDRRDRLWVGHQRGLCRFENGACVPVPGLSLPPVRAVVQDRRGTFWFALDRGLCQWREGQPGPPRCLTPADGLPDATIRTIRETADGALWVGTESGLARLRGSRLRVFTTADGLSGNVVRSLYQDSSRALWVGTGGRGLNRITDLASDLPRVARIRARDGLADDVVVALVEDGQGRLWMSTNRGISWARRAELDAFADGRIARVHTALYTEADGLRNREGNGSQQAAIRARDGRLWFATQDGAAVVDPSDVGEGTAPVRVRIEGVASGGAAWSARTPMHLGARQRSFDIAYTALTFVAPEAVQFRYRLDGFDRAWVEAGARRTAFYTNVPPGNYTFRVAARTRDGRWTAAPPLTLSVAPFAYETGAFRLLASLLMLGAVLALVRWRTRTLRHRAGALSREVDARTRDLVARTDDLVAAHAVVSSQAERLRDVDAAKNRLFANLSHEFRTPLTLILGPLQSSADGAYGPLPEPVRARDALMLRNGRRLLRLVNQVLDLARLEAGGLGLHPAPHDLPAFVRQTTLAFIPLAERQRLALTVDVDAAPAVAVFDREQIERVMGNLISNALKFSPPGGSVRVECRGVAGAAEGDGVPTSVVEIVVSDTGIGLTPEDTARVFDRFFQVDASSTRAREGSGIGLTLARELVELHGGTLDVESAPGGPDGGPSGSRFTVRLPQPADLPALVPSDSLVGLAEGRITGPTDEPLATLASPDGGALPGPPDLDGDISGDDRTTVLVVDDNADLRAYLRQVLEPDYRVVEAADGAEALALARAALPDLVVADVMMPVMDGLAFTRALRADPATDSVPVVLLTARSGAADEIDGLDTGADDFLTKPFAPDALRARVRNLVAMRERLRDRLRDRTQVVPAPAVAVSEPPFTARVRAVILAHLTDEAFTVEALAAEVALSYSQLYRRLTGEGSLPPRDLIRTVRLDAAARLLEAGKGNVSEVAFAVGFQSLAQFSRAFRTQFGIPPSAYAAAAR